MGGVSDLDWVSLPFTLTDFWMNRRSSSMTIFVALESQLQVGLAIHQGIKPIPPAVEWNVQ